MDDLNYAWMIAGVGVILGEWIVYTAIVVVKWVKERRDRENAVKEQELIKGVK